MRAGTESDVLTACLQFLHLRGVWAWRNNQGAIPLREGGFRKFVGLRGASDILGVLPQTVEVVGEGPVRFGNFLAVEVKKPGGRLRPEQREFLERVVELGGVAVVAHSVQELERELAPYL